MKKYRVTIDLDAFEILASVLENWVHGGDADCIIAEFEEELMKK